MVAMPVGGLVVFFYPWEGAAKPGLSSLADFFR